MSSHGDHSTVHSSEDIVNKLESVTRKEKSAFMEDSQITSVGISSTSRSLVASSEAIRRKPAKPKRTVCTFHCDIIGDQFWTEHSEICGTSMD